MPGETVDQPKLLSDSHARTDRLAQLRESHIAPLTEFVEALRHKGQPDAVIPDFDPWDGGTDADILYLLEAPGPQSFKSSRFSWPATVTLVTLSALT